MSKSFRIAAAQYDIGEFQHWDQYVAKLEQWVGAAVGNGAQLLVFPEYASMELVSLFQTQVGTDLAKQLTELQDYLTAYIDLHHTMAQKHKVYIVAGSFPAQSEFGVYHNRVHVFSPQGNIGVQDKLNMTRFEAERWKISAANEIKVFDASAGTLAIDICYDVEFPDQARRQVEAGTKLIIVPSCTDTLAGYHRVRIGCQARALENQCYVVQAATVGNAPWSEAVDVNIGAAGVFAPPDKGFPDTGVVALGELNTPTWVFADLDFEKVDTVRADGQVLNYRDGKGALGLSDRQVVKVNL